MNPLVNIKQRVNYKSGKFLLLEDTGKWAKFKGSDLPVFVSEKYKLEEKVKALNLYLSLMPEELTEPLQRVIISSKSFNFDDQSLSHPNGKEYVSNTLAFASSLKGIAFLATGVTPHLHRLGKNRLHALAHELFHLQNKDYLPVGGLDNWNITRIADLKYVEKQIIEAKAKGVLNPKIGEILESEDEKKIADFKSELEWVTPYAHLSKSPEEDFAESGAKWVTELILQSYNEEKREVDLSLCNENKLNNKFFKRFPHRAEVLAENFNFSPTKITIPSEGDYSKKDCSSSFFWALRQNLNFHIEMSS